MKRERRQARDERRETNPERRQARDERRKLKTPGSLLDFAPPRALRGEL